MQLTTITFCIKMKNIPEYSRTLLENTEYLHRMMKCSAHLLQTQEKLVNSCIVALWVCEEFTKTLNSEWNSKVIKKRKNRFMRSKKYGILHWIVQNDSLVIYAYQYFYSPMKIIHYFQDSLFHLFKGDIVNIGVMLSSLLRS